METIWVVSSTALLVFCSGASYFAGHHRGFKSGARRVLREWKACMEIGDNDYDR